MTNLPSFINFNSLSNITQIGQDLFFPLKQGLYFIYFIDSEVNLQKYI